MYLHLTFHLHICRNRIDRILGAAPVGGKGTSYMDNLNSPPESNVARPDSMQKKGKDIKYSPLRSRLKSRDSESTTGRDGEYKSNTTISWVRQKVNII
jgi:hypothetical protein